MRPLASLETTHDATAIRREVLSEYVRLTGADYGVFHDSVRAGDGGPAIVGQVLVDGPEPVRRAWKALEATPYRTLGLGVEHISAMDAVTSVTASDLPQHWLDLAWKPVDVQCALRINVLDGQFFGGQLAAVRVSSRPAFGRDETRAAQGFLPAALHALRRACRLSRATGSTSSQLFRSDGTPWMCTSAPFPVERQTPGLKEWIGQICRDNVKQASRFFGRYHLRADALSGRGQCAVLVSASPTQALRVPRVLLLTPTQRQVASYAASGATVNEIAEHLERSPDTVKSHLKTLYKELGVASRVELRGRVQNFLTHS